MAIAEVMAGFWLMLFAVKTQPRGISNPVERRLSALSSRFTDPVALVIGVNVPAWLASAQSKRRGRPPGMSAPAAKAHFPKI